MLDEMPQLEVEKIYIWSGDDELIKELTQKPMFTNKQDLYRIIYFTEDDVKLQTEPYQYVSLISGASQHDMSNYWEQAGIIWIDKLDKDLNIDWICEKVNISSEILQNFQIYNVGTQRFLESVQTVIFRYESSESLSEINQRIRMIEEYFKNLK